MSGSGYRTFAAGEVLTASNVQGYLMKQAIMYFASAAARDAVVTAPEEGMFAYLADTDITTFYNGTQWLPLIYGGSYTTYTPAWTSTGTAPVLGNGTASGRYRQEGKAVTFYASISMGSTTTFGTGSYNVSLPVTPAITSITQNLHCRCFDSSASANFMGICTTSSGTAAGLIVNNGGAGGALANASPTVPMTWASPDVMWVWGTYELA